MDRENLDYLTEMVTSFCDERDWEQFHNPKDLAIGLVTEASELLEIFRFASVEEVQEKLEDSQARQDIADELADIFFFLLRFSQMNKIHLGQALLEKIIKNAKKYPLEKSRGSNKKYTEL